MISCKSLVTRSVFSPLHLHQVSSKDNRQLTGLDDRYDFEYEDADDDESGDVGIENKYYNAKQMKGDNPEEAIDEFLGVPALEEDKSDWYIFSLPLDLPFGLWFFMLAMEC